MYRAETIWIDVIDSYVSRPGPGVEQDLMVVVAAAVMIVISFFEPVTNTEQDKDQS